MLLLLSQEKPPLAMCTFQDILKALSNADHQTVKSKGKSGD